MNTDNITANIRITNLRLRTYIGFNPEERAKPQDVVIQIAIDHAVRDEAFQDDVGAALNYKIITKAVIEHVENGRFLLLERLTKDVLDICSADPAVLRATVTIDKPHALRFADSVSVTLQCDKSPFASTRDNAHDHASHSHHYAS